MFANHTHFLDIVEAPFSDVDTGLGFDYSSSAVCILLTASTCLDTF